MIKTEHKDELKHVPVIHIQVNPYQPRRDFCQEDLEELAQSIRTVGILHPPLVRPISDSHLFELISGERRLRAAQLADLSTIPVYIRQTDYETSAQAALIENIQRVDLNPLEISKALKRLIEEFGVTQDQLSQQIGKKRSTIANYLRLLSLPKAIQESLLTHRITMGHAKAILALEREEQQQLLHNQIVRDHLNVREAEKAARQLNEKEEKTTSKALPKDCYLENLINKMREKFGTDVSIQGQGTRGRIQIDYYSLDDLDRLLAIFGVSHDEDL